MFIVVVVLVFFGCGKIFLLMGEVGKGIIFFCCGVKEGIEELNVEFEDVKDVMFEFEKIKDDV